MAEITSQADCGHHRCYGSCGYQQPAKPLAPTADELMAEVKRQAAEIERLRGVLLWTLWHHQGGSSPIGQPIRRALGMGQFDSMAPEQIERGKRFGVSA